MAEVGSRRNILWRKVEGEEAGRVMHPQIGLSLLMVGLLLGTVSCGDNQGPTPSGSVEITTATTGPDPDADGYEITIDEGSQAAIGTNASLRHDNLAPGTHAVLLTGIAANCSVAGENPRQVPVESGGTASVAFVITCTALPEGFTTTTSQEGTLLVLQNHTSTETVRIGLETLWGGSIVEVSLNGIDYVNRHDTGREVQPAFYDGNDQYDACSGCTGVFGWDPTLGGDKYSHGTPILAQALTSNSLYTKAQPLEWDPDNKGGGSSTPVAGDLVVEQTVTPVSGHARAFKVHYTITHLGSDRHANTGQEFPAVYANADYNRFVHYDGTAPWTGAAVSISQFPVGGAGFAALYAPEHWGAEVNAANMGLTVYVPSQYPYLVGADFPGPSGPVGDGTNYFAPSATLTIGPHYVFEGDMYLIAGDYLTARQIVYDLHQHLAVPDIFSPFGNTDAPSPGSTISGIAPVEGWTFDDNNVAKVEILVDGTLDGSASYGSARPDVADAWPHAPANIGFSYSLDTAKLANGPHTINVRVTDYSGNVAVFQDDRVTVGN
jgi:Big-like domain-containing protein